MATEQENLRIIIEVVDKFSKPLNDMRKSLEELGDQGGAAPKKIKTAFDSLRESVNSTVKAISGLIPPLRGLSLSVAGIVAAVSGVALLFNKLSAGADTLGRVARQTGLATGFIEKMEAVNRRLGITTEETRHGLEKFAYAMSQMTDIKKGPAYEYFFQSGHGPAMQEVGRRAAAIKDETERYQYLLSILDQITNQRQRIDFATQVLQNPALASMTKAEREKAGANVLPTSKEAIDKSKEFQDNLHKVGTEWDNVNKKLLDTKGFDAASAALQKTADKAGSLKTILESLPSTKDVWDFLWKPIPGTEGAKPPGKGNWNWRDMLFGFPRATPGAGAGTGPRSELKDDIKEGTSEGIVEGLKKFASTLGGTTGTGYNLGGLPIQTAAYHPGGDGGGATSPGGGGRQYGGGEGPIGGPGRIGRYPPMGQTADASAGRTGPGFAGDVPTVEGGIDRERWKREIDADPKLKERFFRHVLGENKDPTAMQALMESAANRADLRAKLKGDKGFEAYGNLSYFQGYDKGPISAERWKLLEEAYRRVFTEGSDISKGAIDNSSSWLLRKHERTGAFRTTREFAGEGFQIPGTRSSMRGERDAYAEWRRNQLEQARRRNAEREQNKADQQERRRKLKAPGQDASLRVDGNASVKIELAGFPRGTKTKADADGIFSDVELHRGDTAPVASEVG